MNRDIKPIPTHYKGYEFRSRLEARWAVFFEYLRCRWSYETEGFILPSGRYYLPDFKVMCHGLRGEFHKNPFILWIEVKGTGNMTPDDAWKIKEFAGNNFANPILVLNEIPDPDTYPYNVHLNANALCGIFPFNYELIDGDWFGAYPAATSDGSFYLWGDEGNYINQRDIDRVRKALIAARSARFEHGETPQINNTTYVNGIKYVNGIPF